MALTLWASKNVSPETLTNRTDVTHHTSGSKPTLRSPLSVYDCGDLGKASNNTIFVGIASYRDSECSRSIRDLFEQADSPDRVFVGVVLQLDRDVDIDCLAVDSKILDGTTNEDFKKWCQRHVRTLDMSWQQATGPCWARHICRSLWQGEKYFLQIDSHMRFRGKWDSYLVQCLEEARSEETPKPVLSTYPLGYTLPNNVPQDTRATLLVPLKFDGDGMLRQSGRAIVRRENVSPSKGGPIPSLLWASGFSFSDALMMSEVPYDPLLPFLFFGEEISMALRLYTHGYDFFSPQEAVVYHLWSRQHRPIFQESEAVVRERAIIKSESVGRVLKVLRGDTSGTISNFGVGATRSIEDFEKKVGVSFRNCTVVKRESLGEFLGDECMWYFQEDVEKLSAQEDGVGSAREEALRIVKDQLALKHVISFL
jgi:[Skp1-protein]-hydroxyproline N-acetylglucosaminyltransferase